jgi:opine dehydrogenase
MAADLARSGHRVRLWNRSRERLESVLQQGGIEFQKGSGQAVLVAPEVVTTDPASAIDQAQLLMVVVPATGHRSVAEAVAPFLRDGQVVVLNPGRTGGALEFQATLRTVGCRADVIVAEASTFLFAARTTEPGHARIYGAKKHVTFAALPATRNSEVGALLNRVYPGCFTPASSVLETSLGNIGAVFHPAIVLLNTGRIEDAAGDFEFYHRGVTPSVARMIQAVDTERCRIASALGVPHLTALDWMRVSYGIQEPDIYSALRANPGYAGIAAPTTLDHRYLTEDIPTSLVPLASLGHLAGVPTPAIRSLIELASILHGLDYLAIGRTAERLGLDRSSVEEITARAAEGSEVA